MGESYNFEGEEFRRLWGSAVHEGHGTIDRRVVWFGEGLDNQVDHNTFIDESASKCDKDA